MIDSNENWAINFRFESNEMDSVCWCLVYTFRMMCICCRKKKLFTVCYRLRIYAGTKAVCDDTNAINMKTQHRGEMWDISKTHRIFVEFVVSVSSCLVFPFHKRWFAIHKLISIFLFQSILHSFDKGNEMKPIKLKKKPTRSISLQAGHKNGSSKCQKSLWNIGISNWVLGVGNFGFRAFWKPIIWLASIKNHIKIYFHFPMLTIT